MQEKERVIWGIWNGLKKPFWGRSDQSNDEINLIPAHVCRVCDPCLLALKTGMDIRGQVWKRLEKLTLSSSGPFSQHTCQKIYEK